ncbi:DUF1145 domain-containing protein [Thaumasiovibrio sp. DFM-14]|uniref:DUF1145 domain-containing protein n=1 Tax=Thaumasiovibrio sp. DFM-14 TaxID=3384792 RepID=UPI0039A000EC
MKRLLMAAKLAMGCVWLILLINILSPFPGNAAIALYILSAFLFMMHGLQALIFLGAFGDKLSLSGREKWGILLFGVFALLDIRHKHMS